MAEAKVQIHLDDTPATVVGPDFNWMRPRDWFVQIPGNIAIIGTPDQWEALAVVLLAWACIVALILLAMWKLGGF